MKQYLLFILIAFFWIKNSTLHAQEANDVPTHLFRIYEDNDFLNISGNGTDDSYTNGTRFDLFYTKKHPSRFFIDRLLPKAGAQSINVFGWGLTQLMFTPSNITTARYQQDDYSYAGALFASHSLYSYNAKKKYSFRTELIAGIRGPASFAREVQTFIHSVINYDKPQGWDNQLGTYPLLNINFAVEKQALAAGSFIEVIGGAQLSAGSFVDAFSVYPLIRIGKMAPYFDGYLSQHGSYYKSGRKVKTQYYFIVKPQNTFVLHNALLHGQPMNSSALRTKNENMRDIRHRLNDIQFGAVVAHNNFSVSYLQTHSTEYTDGLYQHNWGNISVYFRW